MGLWLGVLSVSVIQYVFGKRNIVVNKFRNKNANLGFMLSYGILFFFRAFRADTVGGDLRRYKEVFYLLGRSSWREVFSVYTGFEKGFLLLNKILYTIYPNFQILLIFTSVVVTIAIANFVKRNSSIPELSLYIYITMYFMGATFNNERQALAIALLMYSFEYVKKRKVLPFTILVLCACSIHKASFAFWIMYPIYNIKLSEKYWILVGVIAAILAMYTKPLLNFFINYFYKKWIGQDLMAGQGEGYLTLLCLIILTVFVLPSRIYKNDPNKCIFIHMLTIAMLLEIVALNFGSLNRLVKVFSVGMIIYIPDMIKTMKNYRIKALSTIMVIIPLFFFYIYQLEGDNMSLVPFQFMWR